MWRLFSGTPLVVPRILPGHVSRTLGPVQFTEKQNKAQIVSPFYMREMVCVCCQIRGLPSTISVEVGSQYQSMNWSKLISEE